MECRTPEEMADAARAAQPPLKARLIDDLDKFAQGAGEIALGAGTAAGSVLAAEVITPVPAFFLVPAGGALAWAGLARVAGAATSAVQNVVGGNIMPDHFIHRVNECAARLDYMSDDNYFRGGFVHPQSLDTNVDISLRKASEAYDPQYPPGAFLQQYRDKAGPDGERRIEAGQNIATLLHEIIAERESVYSKSHNGEFLRDGKLDMAAYRTSLSSPVAARLPELAANLTVLKEGLSPDGPQVRIADLFLTIFQHEAEEKYFNPRAPEMTQAPPAGFPKAQPTPAPAM